ncbi:hypothetical protein [Croceibacterium aestuarii]|uniref:hypothetical protein n=1 Tax=Croceibacterium aestuarii TaxID=3064139 RepID=UPI00272EBA11|nr:hypothetical protein [Croceibacterium sp. D39]
MTEQTGSYTSRPLLEWVAVAIGSLVTAALVGYIGWKAATSDQETPPMVAVEQGQTTPYEGGWVVEVRARNLSPSTAANVEIEGTLHSGSSETTATTTIDYVPGDSVRKAGLFLPSDPARGVLELRAKGYAAP